MKKRSFVLSVAIGLLMSSISPVLASFDTPAPANELISKAKAQAERESKAIFVVFDASW